MSKSNTLHFEGHDLFISRDDLTEDLREALEDCGRPGPAYAAVKYVMETFEVTGDEEDCRDYLRAYGSWDDGQLADHQENLARLVWLTGCGLLEEGGEAYFWTYA